MKGIGIKHQLRITTLVPVLLVALLFAIFYTWQFNRDLNQHMSHLGEAYIHQLLPVAQFAMLDHDGRTLQSLINASTINPDVQSLAFYNAKRQLLAYRGRARALSQLFKPSVFTEDYIEKQINSNTINFISPIPMPKFNPSTPSSDTQSNKLTPLQEDEVLGWISINIDTKSMLIQRYQMYIVTIFITLFGLLISLSIHHFLSKRIYVPIARLRRSMRQILSNEFETQIKVRSLGELGVIEQGCAHLQQHYLETMHNLNQHIEVATSDLQQSLELLEEKNIELLLNKNELEEKSRKKAELVTNMSHEIRTPMNGIIGFANVLLDSNLDALQLDYVKTIKSSAQDLLSIINDILDFSKIDAGKLHLDCIPMDIRACIDDALALIVPVAHKKGIDLIPITAVNIPKTMLGDPLRLKQIITNLVSNAVKFTEHGHVLIRTTVESESDKDYSILLSVTDTGIGISAEAQTTLFNAFNQGDTSITRRYGGSGLGLVICKKLAEHMRGRMTLSSEIYKGSTFSIRIKLEKLISYEAEKHHKHRFSKLCAICYDDNPLHLEALCSGLSHWGIDCVRIDTFNQLEDAFYLHNNCNIAFISFNPGYEQHITHTLHKQTMPCVLVSKLPIQDYESLGAKSYLFKPHNMQKLHDTIDSLTNGITYRKSSNHALEDLRTQLHANKVRLLIAEDNKTNRLLLHTMLSTNAHIKTVEDGQQAVDACKRESFDAILLDLQMPMLNGFEAANLIKQQSILNNNTPMILISANSYDINKEQLASSPIALCLQKPIGESELISHLLGLINKPKTNAINWLICLQKMSGNKVLALDFLSSFVAELAKNRQEFISLIQAGDISGIEHAAHRLLGACCFCGVNALQQQVAALEQLAQSAPSITALTANINVVIESIDAVLHEYQASQHEYVGA